MSAQVIELLFFAGIAFFLVSKLLSVLGTTNEGDSNTPRSGSFFGEPGGMKDVTQPQPSIETKQGEDLKDFIVEDNSTKIISSLQDLNEKMSGLDLKKFVRGSKVAFEMILGSYENKDSKTLESLVDKRFIESFSESAARYGAYNGASKLEAKVSDIYMFGHTAFIKVLLQGSNVTSKLDQLEEEWTFTKNVSQSGPEWFLSNIEIL